MFKYFSLSHMTAGLVSVLIGYTSAAAIVFQAAIAGGATPEHVASWMWALGIGMGVSGIGLSIFYRHPIMIAWSTPGAALLVTSLPGIPMADAVGAFLFCSVLITLVGITGWFERIMQLIPKSLASAMLAGILLRFGLDVFTAMETNFLLPGLMLLTYILGKRFFSLYVIPVTFLTGLIIAAMQGTIQVNELQLTLTTPVYIMPHFSIPTMISVGIPLFAVTMASQNIPGITVLRAHGYDTPASPLIGWSGLTGLLLAPFGGFAFNLAAITASICMGEDIDKDPGRRYLAAIWAGFFYILAGLFGIAVVSLLAAIPKELVMAIAGLALLGTIAGSLQSALEIEKEREVAFLTFAITASGISLFSISGAFWGLAFGVSASYFFRHKQNK